MPLLRAGELAKVVDKARISHAIRRTSPSRRRWKAPATATGLLSKHPLLPVPRAARPRARGRDPKLPDAFPPTDTASDDHVLIAFTSGTTGTPKGCIHYHRDVLAMTDTFARHILKPEPSEVICGTPPIAFTFGLGGLVIFPASRFGARAIALPRRSRGSRGWRTRSPAISVTTLFTAPTGYRALLKSHRPVMVRAIPEKVRVRWRRPCRPPPPEAWNDATGIRIIDGIGATEMIHIFISACGDDVRPGATGRPVPGFIAEIQDDDGRALPGGETGRLAVRGPAWICRYLADPRQAGYVQHGWNTVTGDVYRVDEDGYFWFVSRADDMIISAGYNIGAPEDGERAVATPQGR